MGGLPGRPSVREELSGVQVILDRWTEEREALLEAEELPVLTPKLDKSMSHQHQ